MNRIIVSIITMFAVSFLLEKTWERARKEPEKEVIILPETFSKIMEICMYVSIVCAVFVILYFGRQSFGISIVFLVLAFLCLIFVIGFKRYRVEFKMDHMVYTPVFGRRKKILYTEIDKMVLTMDQSVNIVSAKGEKLASIDKTALGYKKGINHLKDKGISLE